MTAVPPRPEAEEDPPLDRTISPIAGPLAVAGRGKALAFAGLLAGCAAVALATWSADRPRPAKPRETPARQVVAFEPAPAPPPPAPSPPGRAAAGVDGPGASGLPAGEDVPALDPGYGQGAAPGAASPALRQGPRGSPLMAYSRGEPPSAAGPTARATSARPTSAGPSSAGPSSAGPSSAGGGAGELDALRQGSAIGRAMAAPVGDRNFLILAGTTIPCVLQTAIDTATAGYVTCLVDRDVYSDNGAVVLLEKGARVLGEYRSGLRQGRDRVFVLWTRAVTPNGVAISLASPASDALGRAGFGGRLDTRFWDRFGAAILLSVIDAGAAAAGDRDGAAGVVRQPSDAAGLAVRQGADIGPTLRKAQGGEVAIQVAQDLDFSSVYGLRPRP